MRAAAWRAALAAAAALAALAALAAALEWRHSLLASVDQDREDEAAIAKQVAEWEAAARTIPKLDDGDVVDVIYAEHLLASWVLQASPWNAYHSGMVFRVKSPRGEKKATYTVDYTPFFTDRISYVLHPLIDPIYPSWMPKPLGVLWARLTDSYDMVWQNKGATRYYTGVPSKFTNFTFVGTTDGATFNKLMDWVHDYDRRHKTFEPVEIVVNGTKTGGHGSRMCHDLFYYALAALVDMGFQPTPADFIFRDHIMVFAESYEKVDVNDPEVRRDVIRYFRMFISFMDLINQEFTNIRNLLVSADTVAVTPYLYLGGEYYKVKLVPPYVNYCYLTVSMPPERSSVWDSEHLCALEQRTENLHNSTTWGTLKSLVQPRNLAYVAEQAVDDTRTWLTVVVLTATFATLFGGQEPRN